MHSTAIVRVNGRDHVFLTAGREHLRSLFDIDLFRPVSINLMETWDAISTEPLKCRVCGQTVDKRTSPSSYGAILSD